MTSVFLTTGAAARVLNCSPELVRVLERRGRLRVQRAGRYRLFRERDVLRLKAERESRHRGKEVQRLAHDDTRPGRAKGAATP
jgi:excisionase family DNA binding protein